MKLLLILFAIFNLSLADEIEKNIFQVCYEGYGCFINTYPFWDLFNRPLALLPQSPSTIATKLVLFTRQNSKNGVVITANNPGIYFGANKMTRFISHGFLDTINKQWVIDMKDALLRVEDSNVILVDWSKGNFFPYTQATANTQIVGAEIAILVNSYISKGLITADKVHIIGHSLGSHIAGYAGERIPNLGRITGLDPAGPYFEFTDTSVRLDKSDAKFVDVIHSDGSSTLELGLGLMQASGHVDFYPNGGKKQPNCPATGNKIIMAVFNLVSFDLQGVEDSVVCQHMAAVHFYTDSIEEQDCLYHGYQCNNYNDFKNGNCVSCSAKGCNRMGHWASPSKDLGSLFFSTQGADKYPYCLRHYKIKATSNNLFGLGLTKGKVTVSLVGSLKKSTAYVLDDSNTMLSANTAIQGLGEAAYNIGTLEGVELSFTREPCFLTCFLLNDKWSFKSIEVTNGQTQTTTKFCPTQTYVNSGSTIRFNIC